MDKKLMKSKWEAIPTPETVNGGDYQARVMALGALSNGDDAIIVVNYTNKNGHGNIHSPTFAKIIAAAPDLLEALIFCRSVLESQGLFDRSEQIAFEKATAAIAKATD